MKGKANKREQQDAGCTICMQRKANVPLYLFRLSSTAVYINFAYDALRDGLR